MSSPIFYKKTAAQIANIPVVDGQVLFETDQGENGKIFLDNGTTRLQIGGNFLPVYNVTFLSTGWSGSAPYTQTVNVSGMTEDFNFIPTLNQSAATSTASQRTLQLNFNYILYYDSNNGSVTATAPFVKPTVNLAVKFVGQ